MDQESTTRSPLAKNILVVEDSTTYVFVLRKILSQLGIKSIVAGTLQAALRELEMSHFDAILLDLNLPDSSGLDTLHSVLAVSNHPVVVLTSNDDQKMASEAVLSGIDDYIIKGPLDSASLAQALNHTTERHVFRAKLKAMAEELKAKNEQLKEQNLLLGMAAHDIRNPIGVMLAYTDFLHEDAGHLLTEEQISFLEGIKQSGEFVAKLVRDLLDMSTINAGHLVIEPNYVDIGSLVAKQIDQINTLSGHERVRVRFEQPATTIGIHADSNRIKQVMNNLLSNAIKYSPSTTSVFVRVQDRGDRVEISVEDHGSGIPREEIDRLFRPFSTTSVRATTGEKSTGLGLAIVRRIVEAHGGEILVESAVGKGTTFRVILPQKARTMQKSSKPALGRAV